jgi:hypothetical protein
MKPLCFFQALGLAKSIMAGPGKQEKYEFVTLKFMVQLIFGRILK